MHNGRPDKFDIYKFDVQLTPILVGRLMLLDDIRKYILIPTLQVTDLYSKNAEILILGTGMIESGYNYLMQEGNPKNGGIGFFQQEPSDFNDISAWLRIASNRNLYQKILSACYFTTFPTDALILASNIKFSILMCRVHYLRILTKIPDFNDAEALANYHYKYYNGNGLGKTNIENNIKEFQEIIKKYCSI